RIAVGPPVEPAGDLVRYLPATETRREVLRDVCLGEQLERELGALAMALQPMLYFEQWVLPDRQLDGSIGPNDEEPGSLTALRQIREQSDGRTVAPVWVFEDQDDAALCRQGFDRLSHLAEHPLRRGARYPALQCFGVGLGHERRHLGEPHRREAPQ